MATKRVASAAVSLEGAISEYKAELREWQASDRQLPRPEYFRAIDAICDAACRANDVDPYLYEPIAELIRRSIEFKMKQAEEDLKTPDQNLYRALEMLASAQPKIIRPTETVIELLELPGMSLEQVGKMHGISLGLVGRMLALIKKHEYKAAEALYPKNHVTPEMRERQRAAWRDKQRYRRAVEDWMSKPDFDQIVASADDPWTAPPESPEELLALPGMTVEQVAKMHRMPVEQVAAIRDGKDFTPEDLGTGDDMPIAVVDGEIVSCSLGGATVDDIVEMLNVPKERVEQVLAAAEAAATASNDTKKKR